MFFVEKEAFVPKEMFWGLCHGSQHDARSGEFLLSRMVDALESLFGDKEFEGRGSWWKLFQGSSGRTCLPNKELQALGSVTSSATPCGG